MVNLNVGAISPGKLATNPKDRGKGCCCPDDEPPRDPEPPKPPPNQYELTFQKLYCVDESDPEWFGSDEPYVVFGVITEEMAEAGHRRRRSHTRCTRTSMTATRDPAAATRTCGCSGSPARGRSPARS